MAMVFKLDESDETYDWLPLVNFCHRQPEQHRIMNFLRTVFGPDASFELKDIVSRLKKHFTEEVRKMRTLYYVPMRHPQEELGTMIGPLQRLERLELGVQGTAMCRMQKEKEFGLVAEKVIQIQTALECPNLCIYMDGFPAEEPEVEKLLYADFVYKKRFPTYLLIDRLIQKGAMLVGTENPELLREEYQYIQELARVVETQELPEDGYDYKRVGQDILEKRDEYIAGRIDSTLKDGNAGILFIGAMHQVEKKLPDDIDIIRI